MSELYDKQTPQDDHVTDLLSAYIDNRLEGPEHARVQVHLGSCADCRGDYIQLRTVQQMLHSMPDVRPPRAFTLTEADVAAPERLGWLQRLLRPRYAPRLAVGSVLAFSLMVLFLLGSFMASSNYGAATSVANVSGPDRFANPVFSADQTPAPAAVGDNSKLMSAPAPTETTAASGGARAELPTSTVPSAGIAAAEATSTSAPPAVAKLPSNATPGPASRGSNFDVGGSENSSPTTTTLSAPPQAYQGQSAAPPAPAPGHEAASSKAAPSGSGPSFVVWVAFLLAILGILLALGAVLARRSAVR